MEYRPVVIDDIVYARTVDSVREITVDGDPLQIDLPEGSTISNIFCEVTGALTQANIIAMNGAPIELIPAPGAGKAIVVDEVELFHDYATAAYTSGGDVRLEYDGSTDIVMFASTILTATSDANVVAKPSVYDLDNSTGTSEGVSLTTVANKGVEISNETGAFADGNASNVLKYRIRYHVLTLLT